MRREAQRVVEWLDEECAVLPLVGKIQAWTGIPASLQAFVFLNYLIFQAVTGGLANEIGILAGTIYPALKSIQALQTDTDVEDDKTWLTYWMCYGALTVADMHVGWILQIIPFYYTLKLFFMIWLQLPLGPLMGAKVVYRVILKPVFRCIGPAIKRFQERHADDIYNLEADLKGNFADIQKQAMETGTTMFVQQAMDQMKRDKETAENSPVDEDEDE